MPKALSLDLRQRIVAAWKNEEGSFATLAERFDVGEASVNRYIRRDRETGSVAPSPMGGARRKLIVGPDEEAVVRELLANFPECTLAELCEGVELVTKTKVSTQVMSEALRRFGFSKKKGLFARRRQIVQT